MTRFCLTVHPIWGSVLGRHKETLGAGKCKIYMSGIPKEHAHQLILDCINADESAILEILRPMLAHDLDVIQVQGLCVVGTPMGASQYIREYVRSKCGAIYKDVEQMRVCSDPLIRYQLLKFCMNTRLSFLSRNVTPDNVAICSDDQPHIGPIHVYKKIVREVLRAATSDTIKESDPNYSWYTLKAPRGRIRDNSVRSVRVSSILLGHKQIRRAPRKSPTRGRLGTSRVRL
jgi:hypothetical protein